MEVRPFFFGASLVALRKKCGGVRPIAVGCSLRRLVAKVACKQVAVEMAELLAPRQLGFGVCGGSEAAVHAAVVSSADSAPSNLLWGDRSVSSAEGVQQGDALGPLLFCLVLHQHSLHLRSEVQTQYLDDVTLGGDCEDLVHDVQVMREASDVGLCLNLGKCEIISSDMTLRVGPYLLLSQVLNSYHVPRLRCWGLLWVMTHACHLCCQKRWRP